MKSASFLNILIGLFILIIFITPTFAIAETVILKSGQKLEGKITEQTDKYIKIDTGIGIAVTYYADEIDTIDGQKLKSSVPVKPIEILPPAVIEQQQNPTTPQKTVVPSEQQASIVAPPPVEVLNNETMANDTGNQIKPASSSINTSDIISKEATQQEVDSTKQGDNYPYIGFWETNCSDDSGLSIDKVGNGLYSVSFCFPQGCSFKPGTYRPNTTLINDPNYNIIDANTIEIKGIGGTTKYYRCNNQPRKYDPKKEKANWIINIVGLLYFIGYASGLHRLAQKCNISFGWLAWIPFVDFYVKCRIGEKPWWLFIPFYGYSIFLGLFSKNLAFFVLILIWPIFIVDLKVWIGILKKSDKPLWWLWFIYLLGGPLIPVWYLATRKEF